MTLVDIFGEGKDLAVHHMAAGAVAIFFVTLVFVRFGGMRAFGRKSSFDTIIVITLGAVLSRAVTGASPAIPTIVAGGVIVLLHRVIAIVTAGGGWLEKIVKGHPVRIYADGKFDRRAMRLAGLSNGDVLEAVRRLQQHEDLDDVAEVFFESSGELTVIAKASRRP